LREFGAAPTGGASKLAEVSALRSPRSLVTRIGSARTVGGIAIVLLLTAFGLAACGASATHTNAAASSRLSDSSTAAGGSPEGCRRVSAPTPKGVQHVPPPRLRLNPAKRYVVALATNCGAIAIQLDVKRAPRTTASFAYLVQRGFYNDLTFHRVAVNFVIQGGDPNGDGSGGPGYTIVERPPANLRYTRGTVAMAKTDADPAGASGSQFFIVTAKDTELPPQYALLGKVVGSMAGVNAISTLQTVPPQDGEPIHPVVISRATLSET
jgi:peptidyl-prolyl cis-trans isomerase B (cyclophilin B)